MLCDRSGVHQSDGSGEITHFVASGFGALFKNAALTGAGSEKIVSRVRGVFGLLPDPGQVQVLNEGKAGTNNLRIKMI